MAKLVTIYGGSGFVGRHVAQAMARRGWRVRVAVRRPDEALFTRTYGVTGQVVPVLCNIRDAGSVAAVMEGADAVVNAVNILASRGASTFDAIFRQGAEHIARLSAEQGVARVVHISGLGTDLNSKSRYVRAKSEGEAAVIATRPDAVILRPSVIFGNGDSFYNRFAGMARMGLILPIAGGNTKMQPVFVEDVAEAAALGAEGAIPGGIYELGGPEVLTLREIVGQVLTETRRRRAVVNMPMGVARIGAGALDLASTLTGGLFTNSVLSRDQLALLAEDNVVTPGAKGFAEMGITPTAPQAVIGDYLWRFRPSGQYTAVKESARNLRAN